MRMIRTEDERDEVKPSLREPSSPPNGYSTVEMMRAARGQPCPYCSATMMPGTKRFPTRDHIRPRSAGGKLTPGNCAIVCGPCNVSKGSKSLEQFADYLAKHGDPRAPFVRAFIEELRRGGRAVEGTRLENEQTEASRGFESTPSPPFAHYDA